MKNSHTEGRRKATAFRRVGVFGGAMLLACGGMLPLTVSAAAPPAGTLITNVATATYTDAANVGQTTQSNPVSTKIQQVGSFELSPYTVTASEVGVTYGHNGVTGAAGQTVQVQYVVKNTGNGTDNFRITTPVVGTFSTVTVYPDVNADGLADAGAPAITPTTDIAIPAGGTYTFVVAYAIPGTATGAWTSDGNVAVTAQNTPTGLGYPNLTLTRRDTVNLTTTAAFSTAKSISWPAVGTNATWTAAPAVPVPAPNSGPTGTKTLYTLTYVNNGAVAGNLYLHDVIGSGATAGLAYVANSAQWSGSATALTDPVGGDAAGVDFQAVTVAGVTTIDAVVANVLPGQSGTVSFAVTINATAAVGTTATTNTATYSQQTCGATATVAACTGAPTTPTGGSPFTVTATRAVTMTATGTAVTGVDVPANSGLGNGTGDTRTVASAVPGGAVKFTYTVFNTGNDVDTFDLDVAAAAPVFPPGTVFTWFQSDGVTPLQNTSGTTSPDTGPLASGASISVVLQAVLPANAAPFGAVNYTELVKATSVGDSTKLDAAKAVVTNLLPGVVDLKNSAAGTTGANGDIGPGTSAVVSGIAVTAGGPGNNGTQTAAPATPPANAAGSAVFTLVVDNNDTGPLTFNLQASSSNSFPGSLPAGWTVGFYSDAAATVAVTNTGAIAAGGNATVYAKVTPPANAAGGAYDVYFRAVSTGVSALTGGAVSDYKRDQVVVAAAGAYSMALTTTAGQQVSPGNSATYSHTLTNTGANTCGAAASSLVVQVENAAGAVGALQALPAGWTYSVYVDNNADGVLDASELLTTSGSLPSSLQLGSTLPVNGSKRLWVRVFSAPTAPAGTAVSARAIVTDTSPAPNCGTVFVVDTTTVVVTGQMQVTKGQAVNAACDATVPAAYTNANLTASPGQCLWYEVVATNTSTANMTNVLLSDVVPTYTTYAAGPALATQCLSSAGAPTLTAGTVAGTTVSCGTVATLPPGGTVTLRYAVKIDQ